MGDRYIDDSPSGSDQDDLQDDSDLDVDLSDTDDLQFSFCKPSNQHLLQLDGDDQSSTTDHVTRTPDIRLRWRFFTCGISLMTSSLALVIFLPLYYQQMSLSGKEYNAYGSLIFISFIVTLLLVLVARASSILLKWENEREFYRIPISWKSIFSISGCCGLAGTFCTISSYQRVPCHLQDPLKAAALVYALVFYFFFCRKVMGLQRIFSATTAVVGLFISVDYGLCDEFRCRGADIPVSDGLQQQHQHTIPSPGWQGRALWTLIYVAGIALWTLHLSLLEQHVVTFTTSLPLVSASSLLTTVSRIVSNAEPLLLPETAQPTTCTNINSKCKRKQPHALHLAAWIHVIGFLFIIVPFGLIDIIPATGHPKPWSEFLHHTGKTLQCHLHLQINVPDSTAQHQATLDYLSNLVPGSVQYNQTVQKLRRSRRNTNSSSRNNDRNVNISRPTTFISPTSDDINRYVDTTKQHKSVTTQVFTTHPNNERMPNKLHPNVIKRSGTNVSQTTIHNGTKIPMPFDHLNATAVHSLPHNTGPNGSSLSKHIAPTHPDVWGKGHNHPSSSTAHQRKVNSDKYWRKLKAHANKYKAKYGSVNQTPDKVSELVVAKLPSSHGDCARIRVYSWMVIFAYLVFAVSLFQFICITESAVFTVAVAAGSLPLVGIFWSIFEIKATELIASIIVSPDITGELICSLLGTPIVLLGLGLLSRAFFSDTASISVPTRSIYTSLSSAEA